MSRYMRLPVNDPRLVASYGFFAKDAYFGAPKITWLKRRERRSI